jgi:hypothetical protein
MFSRTLASEWTYRQVFVSNADRATACQTSSTSKTHRRRHTALGGNHRSADCHSQTTTIPGGTQPAR